jgi:hypothetical protein
MEESTRILPWMPDSFQEWPTIQVVNRYFSPSNGGASPEASLLFDDVVDPIGILASLQRAGYRHTADNKVGYFKRVKSMDDLHFKYISAFN